MNVVREGSRPPAPRGVVAVAAALSIPMGIGLAALEKRHCAITPWLDLAISVTPLFTAGFMASALLGRTRPHFMVFMLLHAGMSLAPLFVRPTSAAWFVLTGLLWCSGVAACARGNRRAGAGFMIAIGCLLTGLQLWRLAS